MEVLKDIHLHKVRISKKNQPIFDDELDILNSTLQKCSHEHQHPYSLKKSCKEELLNCSSNYKKGAQLTELRVQPKHQYLYRYVSLNSILNHPNWLDNVVDKEYAFEILKYKVRNGDWYNLGKTMTGLYNNRRGFSWWTDIFPEKIEQLYALGIPSDWILPESLILRIDIKKNNHLMVKMPSAIDGYDAPVFDTQSYKNKLAGKTLNLNNKTDFSGGLSEYVIGEIDASYIDIVPILFDTEHKIMLTDLYNNLSRYYKNK